MPEFGSTPTLKAKVLWTSHTVAVFISFIFLFVSMDVKSVLNSFKTGLRNSYILNLTCWNLQKPSHVLYR